MNWSPIAIVQDFQAQSVRYDRIILVAAVDRGLQAGTISCRRWLGGKLAHPAIQDRIFEAVTGIISLDNLLVIGEHFKIWPEELLTVEVQLEDTGFGDFVLSELALHRELGEAGIVGENPPTPENEKIVREMVLMTEKAAVEGVRGMSNLHPLTAEQLTPLTDVCHNQLLNDCYMATQH